MSNAGSARLSGTSSTGRPPWLAFLRAKHSEDVFMLRLSVAKEILDATSI